MSITTDSPILGTGSGVVIIPNEAQRKDELAAYQTELTRLSKMVGFNEDILIAQSAHETANWTSHWWIERLNPAGIGITGDPVQNAASPTYATGQDAARAHTVHFALYVYGSPVKWSPAVRGALYQYRSLDPRFNDVALAGFGGSVKVLGDLGNGKWAVDPKYAEKIAAKANALFKEETMAITFGKVPYPSVIASYLPASNPYVEESGAPDVPDAMFWHRMIGTWEGTNIWFHGGHAATAYGVAVSAMDGAAKAGLIYEWIKPRTGWYGESSGPVKAPYGDGAKFVNEVGVNSVNRRSKAIEISGNVDTLLDDKARDAIANMTAYWADQKHIPWNEFPIIPGGDRSFVIWHNEITGMAFKTCPGAVVMNETNALIERTRAVMKKFQESSSVPTYAKPAPISWKKGDVGTFDQNGTPALAFLIELKVVSAGGVVPVSSSAANAKPTGPKLPKDKEVIAIGAYRAGPHKNAYVVLQDGSRAIRSKFRPLVPLPG